MLQNLRLAFILFCVIVAANIKQAQQHGGRRVGACVICKNQEKEEEKIQGEKYYKDVDKTHGPTLETRTAFFVLDFCASAASASRRAQENRQAGTGLSRWAIAIDRRNNNMSSLLGLANYHSDHTEDEADDDASNQNDAQRSPQSDDSNKAEGASRGIGRRGGDQDEDSNSQFGEPLGIDGGSMRAGILRACSFDAPAPPSKEQKQFFMPLPSPLVRLDNASPSHAASPFLTHDPPNDEPGDAGAEGGEEEGEGGGSGEKEGDRDIIQLEYRDMLPPEATGQANPQLQTKIAKFLDTMQGDFTKSIKGKKDYGNPAVLAQVRFGFF